MVVVVLGVGIICIHINSYLALLLGGSVVGCCVVL